MIDRLKRYQYYVQNIMNCKDKGRTKGPAMTNSWGRIIKTRR